MRSPTVTDLPSPPPGKPGWPWTEESPQLPDTMPDGSPWPRVSIVTPSYNQGQFIEETIRSVLLQGYPNLEYIIMDGGSTDGSVEIIHRYEPWLAYWVSEPDQGQADAISRGFAGASGAILAWLNSDDRYRPGTLNRVARFFATHPETVLGAGDVNHIDARGRFLSRQRVVRPIWLVAANLSQHGWPQPGCFWLHSAYRSVGGVDSSLQFCMDLDLFLRLTRAGQTERIPGPPLADFRHHAGSKTSSAQDVRAKESAILRSRYGTPLLQTRLSRLVLRRIWRVWRRMEHGRARRDERAGRGW